jgi:hypothetical protein
MTYYHMALNVSDACMKAAILRVCEELNRICSADMAWRNTEVGEGYQHTGVVRQPKARTDVYKVVDLRGIMHDSFGPDVSTITHLSPNLRVCVRAVVASAAVPLRKRTRR